MKDDRLMSVKPALRAAKILQLGQAEQVLHALVADVDLRAEMPAEVQFSRDS